MAIDISRMRLYNQPMNSKKLITTVQREIRARRGKLRELSSRCGIPYSTLVKIGQGVARNPRIETIEALLLEFGILCTKSPTRPSKRGQSRALARQKLATSNKSLLHTKSDGNNGK